MVVNPLVAPRGGLGPPIGIQMEGSVVDRLDGSIGVEITSVSSVISPVFVAFKVEGAFAAGGDEVVGVEKLDVGGNVLDPLEDSLGSAVGGTGEVADTVGAAAGLVGELPGHDCGGVLIAVDEDLDVVLEGGNDLGVGVELRESSVSISKLVSKATHVIVVLSTKIDSVHVHSTVISPVVGQGNDKLDVGPLRGADNLVKGLEASLAVVDGWFAILPVLEVNLGRTSTLTAILGETVGIEGAVAVVEAPGTEDVEASVLGGLQAKVDVRLILYKRQCLCHGSSIGVAQTYVVEGKVIGIGASKVKVLAVQLKLGSLGVDKALWHPRLARSRNRERDERQQSKELNLHLDRSLTRQLKS